MKNISRWASSHAYLAILIIIGCEVTNAFTGVLLGLNLLGNWSEGVLLFLAFALIGWGIFVRRQTHPGQPFIITRGWLFGAFLGNYLLFGVLGGLWAERVQTPSPNGAVWGSRQVVMRSDSVVKANDFSPTDGRQAVKVDRRVRDENQTGKRIGYVLLFVLGLALAYLSAGLACALACSGYGFWAGLVLLAGVGVLLGGFFFLSRAFDKVIRPWRETGRPERRKTLLRALFLFLGFWVASILLSAIASTFNR